MTEDDPGIISRSESSCGRVSVRLSPDHPFYEHTYGGYYQESRFVVAQSVGRPLTEKEEVHHRNERVWDNRLENLMLCPDHVTHMAEHRRIRRERLRAWRELP
jgi:hypothetical protein